MVIIKKLFCCVESIRNLNKKLQSFQLHTFSQERPYYYRVLMLILALLGYVYLLAFPLAAIATLIQLFEVSRQPLSQEIMTTCIIWCGLFIFFVAMSHHIFSLKFPAPQGLTLKPDKAPKLFELLTSNQQGWLRISAVIITEKFELEIRKQPICGIPLWSRNVLVIGLPVMQCMPHAYFEIILQRKLVQFAKGRNIVSNWLYQLSYVWSLYPLALSRRRLLGDQLLYGFFKYYASCYKRYSVYSSQRDELMADTLSLTNVNDIDLFKSVETQYLAQYFLRHYYFPLLLEMIRKQGADAGSLSPFTRLPNTYRKMMQPQRMTQWLEKMRRLQVNSRNAEPPLSQRMENMGQSKIRLPDIQQSCAAEVLFGKNYSAICALIDKTWAVKIENQFKSLPGHKRKSTDLSTVPPLSLNTA